ncbi:14515_t:CDS:2 [Acaulospora morrowiae]|uniref:14515_t:CDS:1 n=1 Tax=Acaulospora morrowiae TaxID=94023 RepID=A0A9N9FMZ8_9GLOM|nr:14515_t:CDS:2 [Acaulospora morrowiae]
MEASKHPSANVSKRNFALKNSRREEETISIPVGLGLFIIGVRGCNVRKIRETSGAKIYVNLDSVPPSAKIYGTSSQREQAKAQINEILSKLVFAPAIGFTLLKISDTDRFNAKYQFVEFTDENENVKNVQRYCLEKIKSSYDNAVNANEYIGVAMDGNFDDVPSNGFNTIDKFNQCLKEISVQLAEFDNHGTNFFSNHGLGNFNSRQIQYHIFFGRQTFTKVDSRRIFNVDDFCKFERRTKNDANAISTSFSHNIPSFWKNFEKICGRFGLKLDVSKKDKRSISILYMHDGQRRKMKLYWCNEEGLWKISKSTENVRRHAIIDIVSGTESLDLRFMVKTQSNVSVEPNLRHIIKDLQAERLIPGEEGLWFELKDFEGKLDCIGVRQKISKKCYRNDRFKIATVTTQQEIKGQNDDQITTENYIMLKSLSWRRHNKRTDKSLNINFDDEVVSGSIHEAINFASEIAKSAC